MVWNRVRQVIYLSLTVAGFIWPGVYLVQFITETKSEVASSDLLQVFDLPTFIREPRLAS